MGGHGGINILHQKKWHVYNSDNQAKVARDLKMHADQINAAEEKKISSDLSNVYAKLKKNLVTNSKSGVTRSEDNGKERVDLERVSEKKAESVFGDLAGTRSWRAELPRDVKHEVFKKIEKSKTTTHIPKAKGLNLKSR